MRMLCFGNIRGRASRFDESLKVTDAGVSKMREEHSPVVGNVHNFEVHFVRRKVAEAIRPDWKPGA